MVSYTQEAEFIRFIGNHLIPSKFVMDFHLEISDEADELMVCSALEKFEFWVNNYVDGCLAISHDNDEALQMVLSDGETRIGNPLMLTADNPSDGHILSLFVCKFNAFAKGAFSVDMANIHMEDGGLSNTILGNPLSTLPSMEEWIDTPNWFDEPWWNRPDSSTIDTHAPVGTNFNERPKWAKLLVVSEEIQKNVMVIPGKFSPKVVK